MIAVASGPAGAADTGLRGFNIQNFHQSSDMSGVLTLYGSRTLGHLKPAFRFTLHASGELARVANPVTNLNFDIVDTTIIGDLSAAMGLGRFLDVGMILPVFFYEEEMDVNTTSRSKRAGVGDMLLDVKLKLLGDRVGRVGFGLLSRTSLPTGDPQQFSGWKRPTEEVRLAVDKTFGPFYMAANAGYRFVSKTPVTNTLNGVEWNFSDNDRLIFGGGLQYTPPFQRKSWDVAAAVFGEKVLGNSKEIALPVEVTGSLNKRFDNGVSVEIGGGRGVTSALGSPSFRAFVSVAYDGQRRERVALSKKIAGEPAKAVHETILFSFDNWAISEAAKEGLNEIARVMTKDETMSISVVGHTDSTGSDRYNYKLGLRRAKAAADYLKSLGIDEKRLNVVSFGASKPAASNRTREGRQKNRRVELLTLSPPAT